jgi:plastocyanin
MSRQLVLAAFLLAGTTARADALNGIIDQPALRRKIDLVYVETVPWKVEPPKEMVRVNQRGNVYLPHVIPIMAGTQVEFRSEDPELHNVYARGTKGVLFNEAVLPRMRFERVFTDLGPVHLTCNIHKAMSAWVVVLQNPYFARPDKSGAFSIDGLQPGTYTVRIWGEALSEEQNARTFTFTLGAAPLRIVSR